MEWIYGATWRARAAAGARRRAHRLAATAPALKRCAAADLPASPARRSPPHELDELTGSREHQGVALQVDAFPYAELRRSARRRAARRPRRGDRSAQPRRRGAQRAGRRGRRPRAAAATARRRSRRPPSRRRPAPSSTCPSRRSPTSSPSSRRPRTPAAGCTARPAKRRALVPRPRPHRPRGPRVRRARAAACGRSWRAPATRWPRIPMDPAVESLNVSVAAALFVFEARRQRRAAAASGAEHA